MNIEKEPEIRPTLHVPFRDYDELLKENKRLLALVRQQNREKGDSFNEWWKRYRLAVQAQSCGTISTEAARRIWDAAYELALDTERGS